MTIKSALRFAVWNEIFTSEVASASCPLGCGNTISQQNFECGHIISRANGGSEKLENLIPICSRCNKSMSTYTPAEFAAIVGFTLDERILAKIGDLPATPQAKKPDFSSIKSLVEQII